MTENRYWNLLAKKLSGEANPEEIQELETIAKASPNWLYPAEIIESLWKQGENKDKSYNAELAFELHLNNLKNNGIDLSELQIPPVFPEDFQPKPKRKKILFTLSFCAIAILLITGFFWRSNSKETNPLPEKNFSEVSTRFGSKTKLVLPDSSIVWLNAGSKLTYNEHFGTTNRNTTLSGEAYFDVKKSTIPFIINANGLHIKVLGTAFNVKSYPNEKTTETSLVRGRVEITHDKRPGEIFILKPNEKLVIANEEAEKTEQKAEVQQKTEPKVLLSSLTHTIDNTVIETSWVENKLIFQDESFEEVAKKMERWYNTRIDIKDERIAQLRLSGTFENETIRQALAALKIAFPFNFTMNENFITITR
jgi:transmembrane sensor